MLELIKIAVTGPISSGKSTVCELMSKHGAFVVNADNIVHKLLKSSKPVQNQVNQLLNTTLDFSDNLYRQLIASKIFNDTSLLIAFEHLLHPLVIQEIKEAYNTCLKSNIYHFFVCEVPLLFEIGFDTFFDKIIYIEASNDVCIKRFCKKHPQCEESQWSLRMRRFLPKEDIMNNVSFIIKNDSSLDSLKNQVTHILQSLL
jgi:dephospho-CoA kinase